MEMGGIKEERGGIKEEREKRERGIQGAETESHRSMQPVKKWKQSCVDNVLNNSGVVKTSRD